MAKKVLKFGGTSVGTIERILHVAKIIKREHEAGNQIIAVVSAMSGKTNDLLKQSRTISEDFNRRELDVLLASGEQVTSALLAGALIELGINSKSWLNWQIPILTEGENSNARIMNMNISRINKFLSEKASQQLYGEINFEYPVNPRVRPTQTLLDWGVFREDQLPILTIAELSQQAQKIIDKVGW